MTIPSVLSFISVFPSVIFILTSFHAFHAF
jgi:hypothetical protein